MITVHLVYEGPGRAPLTTARVEGRTLVANVARAAIAEAREKASELDDDDEVLALVQREDADRLERVLRVLVPELRLDS